MNEILKNYVTNIPDFPRKGVIFRDITSVIQSSEGLSLAINELTGTVKDLEFDRIAAIESRGFIFGSILAEKLGKGLVLVRKKGKLPRETVSAKYDLEYGSEIIEIHKDAINAGDRVLIIDDLLATGGTAKTAAHLVEMLGGKVVGAAFLIELTDLGGRAALKDYPVSSIITYEGE